jgi:hypothetical protein
MAISAQQPRTVTEEQINQFLQGMTGSVTPYRIGHPTHPLGFTKDLLQLLGEATVLRPAAFAAAGRSVRRTDRRLP